MMGSSPYRLTGGSHTKDNDILMPALKSFYKSYMKAPVIMSEQ